MYWTMPGGPGLAERVQQAADEFDATVTGLFAFAGLQHRQEIPGVPSVWLQGDACRQGAVWSAQAFTVAGPEIQPLRIDGRPAGAVYEDAEMRCCRLCGLLPADTGASRAVQTRSVFERAKDLLGEHGFRFEDTVRTWIYLDRLLEWYGEFNAVRNAFFEEQGLFTRRVPASTGIGAANGSGSAMVMDLLAIRPKSGQTVIATVDSPLQNPALDYKSAFSRAMEIRTPTHRSLMVSGTASIDPAGRTIFGSRHCLFQRGPGRRTVPSNCRPARNPALSSGDGLRRCLSRRSAF
jgi:enamine deaminase RidA (YjgF/YER057c/UK114 family)